MTQKQFLERLIELFGLTPKDISSYRTSGNGGEYEVGTGWRGKGVDGGGNVIISFYEPDGFDMAVYEIINQANNKKRPIRCIGRH